VAKCREIGIDVPIIPGIKPLATKKQLSLLPKLFNIDIPYELSEEMEKAKTPEAEKQVGIEWAIEQCKGLMKANVPVLHFYTMGKSETTRRIGEQIF
jgi:methylenetetrahydrofolate reductase (NADPH)